MIINWERGKQIFGNSEDLYKKEIYNFINIVVPSNTEKAVSSLMDNRKTELLFYLKNLEGSSK